MGLLDFLIRISVKFTPFTALQDLPLILKHLVLEFFFSKPFLFCKLFSDEQHLDNSTSIEYRPSLWSVPLPGHVINSSIKERLSVEEYGCLVERFLKEEQDHDEDSCAVCLERLEASHKIRELQNCRHLFHKNCLDAWIDQGHGTCPLCRAKLLAGQAGEEESTCTGDPWRSERMIYLFGEDCFMGSTD